MKKAFLLVYNHAVTREEVTDWADDCSLVESWRNELPNCIFLVSESNTGQLSADFDRRFPADSVRYIVQQFSTRSEGMLTAAGWHFLNEKSDEPTS